MRTKIILTSMLLTLLPSVSYAMSAEWLCTQEASERRDNIIASCGVGVGLTENLARVDAFESAKLEFTNICNSSDDCRNHNIVAVPKRTDCKVQDGKHICVRMIEFIIAAPKQVSASNTPTTTSGVNAKLKVGLTKKQVIEMFGKPSDYKQQVSFSGPMYTLTYKSTEFCTDGFNKNMCFVHFKGDKVESFSYFKLEYTDLLE